LNPFHPDIVKFAKDKPVRKCTFVAYSDVTDNGVLIIKDDFKPKVLIGMFAYIVRKGPGVVKYTPSKVFYDPNMKGTYYI